MGLNPFGNVVVLLKKELEDSDFILVQGTHKKRAYGKLQVSDNLMDFYRFGVL